ncbi:MAG: HAMP domain-containing sensor histidine kinase [Rhodoferax sp.]|uniref:ATP-binding protein n=1 Tax=Rhodoferax sp. TaxID=50421 RepID=UPI002733A699|nr:HAMP domain-containing sensor histidine kinase [Rhodoferax sp.]MDP2679426.1 HAMP domain-containing sensor histidine kinase [Rhodoferax sp.]
MLPRLPYRIQIPMGLVLAVILSVLLVSVVAAQISARSARLEIVSTVQRIVDLLVAQGKPLLAQDDTWRAFTLLRNTAALLPQTGKGQSRAALLDAQGRFLAGSDPLRLPTGEQALGVLINGRLLPTTSDAARPINLTTPDGGMTLVEPIRSDDNQVIGFVFAEVDAAVFAPDWAALSTPALIGAALAIIVLVPLGWLLGRRMARPIAQTADCIAQIGRTDPVQLQLLLPQLQDPELDRIAGAVRQLLIETSAAKANEKRALSAERLAAVGRITAAVAHEINNPLAGLITATRTLRLHGDAPDTRDRSLDLIERGLQQIRTMTTALLPQAKVEDRCLTPDDMQDILTLARATAVQHAVAISSELVQQFELCVPSTVFRQVMLNLLLNAIKAAGQAGQVHASLSADANKVNLVILNTGRHLSDDRLQRRLTTDDGNDPNGFGLWICHEFAVRYGGGFTAALAGDIPRPFTTRLSFWLPNLTHHDPQKTAVD